MVKLTPSRLRDYLLCPRQYRQKYLESASAKALAATPALSFGNSLHAALDELHRPDQSAAITLDPEALLRRHWRSEGYATPEQEADKFTVGVQVLGCYSETMLPLKGQIIGTEVYLSRVIAHSGLRFELSCKTDRLELRSDGVLESLDYKTNGDGVSPSVETLAVDLPTFIYYILARLTYPQYSRVCVSQLNLLSLQKTAVEYTADQRDTLKNSLLAVVVELEFAQCLPRAGPHCSWCSTKANCPAFGPEANLDNV